jgi:hypothetical protein
VQLSHRIARPWGRFGRSSSQPLKWTVTDPSSYRVDFIPRTERAAEFLQSTAEFQQEPTSRVQTGPS